MDYLLQNYFDYHQDSIITKDLPDSFWKKQTRGEQHGIIMKSLRCLEKKIWQNCFSFCKINQIPETISIQIQLFSILNYSVSINYQLFLHRLNGRTNASFQYLPLLWPSISLAEVVWNKSLSSLKGIYVTHNNDILHMLHLCKAVRFKHMKEHTFL